MGGGLAWRGYSCPAVHGRQAFDYLYIGSSNMASTYGAAGALIVVFVWVYYSAQILLLGAEFAKAHSDQMQALRELQQTTRIAS